MSTKLKGGAAQKWQKAIRKLFVDAQAREVSVHDLAQMAGLNRGIITHWHTHGQKPRLNNWEKIQKTLESLPVKRPELLREPQVELPFVMKADPVDITKMPPAFDDEPMKPGAPKNIPEAPAKKLAKDIIIDLIVERLRDMDVAAVAMELAHVMEQS